MKLSSFLRSAIHSNNLTIDPFTFFAGQEDYSVGNIQGKAVARKRGGMCSHLVHYHVSTSNGNEREPLNVPPGAARAYI